MLLRIHGRNNTIRKYVIVINLLLIFILTQCKSDILIPPEPAKPTLFINAVSDSVLQLEWTDQGDSLYFTISRKSGTDDWTDDFSDGYGNIFCDTITLSNNNVYRYKVTIHRDGNESKTSEPVAYFPQSAIPGSLTFIQESSSQVKLQWQDNSLGEDRFRIDRKTGSSWKTGYANIDENITEWTDSDASLDIKPIYRICAIADDDNSDFSNTAQRTLASFKQTSSDKLDIITWNIENFAKNTNTVDSVVKIISSLKPDIVAFQEIEEADEFENLVSRLSGYSGFRAISASYDINLAYIYNSSTISITEIYEIYEHDWRPFPRPPLVMKFTFNDQDYALINNHYKCCGDGVISENDSGDEENRRITASEKLHQYISQNLPDEKVIVVGDLNDEITDPTVTNVFTPFLNLPDEYLFADMDIATGDNYFWSFPTYPSHIDHILITNELFDTFALSESNIEVILVEKYLPTLWNDYSRIISDHRPVMISLSAQ